MSTGPQAVRRRRSGFTLTELLVVIAIIVLISAATLPIVLPTIRDRNVNAASLMLQGELAKAQMRAVQSGVPQGIRLMPEPSGTRYAFQNFDSTGAAIPSNNAGGAKTPAYSRLISIEAGPYYREGTVSFVTQDDSATAAAAVVENPAASGNKQYVALAPLGGIAMAYSSAGYPTWKVLVETKFTTVGGMSVPASPTSWYWNIKRGDRIRVEGGTDMVVVGPMRVPKGTTNPEGFINWGLPSVFQSKPGATTAQEFLIVLNGKDDDGDGYVDEAYDGIDNDYDGVIDPGFNGLDDDSDGSIDEPDEMLFNAGGEYEAEAELTSRSATTPTALDRQYEIPVSAVPARGAREIVLPGGMMIDMTTWDSTAERSRLPVDPRTGTIDIMIAPNGQLVQTVGGKLVPYPPGVPFIHFWLADSDGIVEPQAQTSVPYRLPMPEETPAYPVAGDTLGRKLIGNHRLVSVNTRTGQITSTAVDQFDLTDYSKNAAALDRPYLEAQAGVKGVE
jgi:prepilin-type N-terminal cleavage/methylation domain-containing protein